MPSNSLPGSSPNIAALPSTAAALAHMQHFPVILFDLDGTLIDHDTAARTAARRFAEELGFPVDVQRWMDIEEKWFLAFERGEIDHQGQRVARIREYLAEPTLDYELASDYFESFIKHYSHSWTAYPDALPALQAALSQAKVGILTNGADALQKQKLVATGLDLPDLVMLGSTTLQAAKPQPAAFAKAAEMLQVGLADCVLIGDNPQADIHGARAAGMPAIHLDRSAQAPDSIATLTELTTALA